MYRLVKDIAWRLKCHHQSLVLILCICTLSSLSSAAQDSIYLQWMPLDRLPSHIADGAVSLQEEPLSTHLRQTLEQLHSEAFLAASIDSIACDADTCRAWLFVGPRFVLASLDLSQIPPEIDVSPSAGLRKDKPFRSEEVLRLFDQVLTNAENQGYPLASVRLTDLEVVDSTIEAVVQVRLNDYYTIERIELEGNLNISKSYLSYLLNVQPGDPFNRSIINNVGLRLDERAFIKVFYVLRP